MTDASDSTSSESNSSQLKKSVALENQPRIRWWPAIAIVLLAGLGIVYILFFSGLGRDRFLLTVRVALLAILALMVWIGFFSGFSRWVRLIGFLTPTVFGIAYSLIRVDEFDGGNSAPVSWAWRWTSKPHEGLPTELPMSGKAILSGAAHDFPQFMGPNRDGIVPGIRLSRDWNSHPPRELWRIPVGAGWSSFAVVGDSAFTQELRGKTAVIACYRLKTGEPVWFHKDDDVYTASFTDGDGPRATPTVVDGRVYAMGGAGLLNCLDATTGKAIWSRNVLTEFHAEVSQWGKSDSPLVLEGIVVVTGGGERGPSLIAFDKDTGETAWTAHANDGDDDQGAIGDCYASPTLATLHGVSQILNLEDGGVASYDPKTGQQLWKHDWPWHGGSSYPKVSQPMVVPGDRIFFAAGYSFGCSLIQVQKDEAGNFSTRQIWKSEVLKTKFSNAVRRGDYLYGLHHRFLRCIEFSSGQRKWHGRTRYGHGQILLVDDLLLVQAERPGDIALVEARPEGFRELGRIKALATTTWNTMALAGKYLLVRNDREAVCFELSLEPATKPTP